MNLILLRNSLLVSGLTMLLAGTFGFLAALWLAGLGKNWRMRISALAILSLALPPFLAANCWLDLLGVMRATTISRNIYCSTLISRMPSQCFERELAASSA